jgi:hypothetical protein
MMDKTKADLLMFLTSSKYYHEFDSEGREATYNLLLLLEDTYSDDINICEVLNHGCETGFKYKMNLDLQEAVDGAFDDWQMERHKSEYMEIMQVNFKGLDSFEMAFHNHIMYFYVPYHFDKEDLLLSVYGHIIPAGSISKKTSFVYTNGLWYQEMES